MWELYSCWLSRKVDRGPKQFIAGTQNQSIGVCGRDVVVLLGQDMRGFPKIGIRSISLFSYTALSLSRGSELWYWGFKNSLF